MSNVSVIIRTFDPRREMLLMRAIDCVFKQTLQPVEIFILNNHPNPDERLRVRIEAKLATGRVPGKYIEHSGLGGHIAHNYVIAIASGEYFANLDDDDYWDDDYLESCARVIDEDPVDVVVAAYRKVGANGEVLGVFTPFKNHHFETTYLANPGYVISNMVLRRDAVLKVGGFDRFLRTSCDKGLVVDIMDNGGRFRRLTSVHVNKEMDSVGRWSLDPRANATLFAFYWKYRGKFTGRMFCLYVTKVAARLALNILRGGRHLLIGDRNPSSDKPPESKR